MIYLLIVYFWVVQKYQCKSLKANTLMLNVKETLLFVGYVLMWIFGVKSSSN